MEAISPPFDRDHSQQCSEDSNSINARSKKRVEAGIGRVVKLSPTPLAAVPALAAGAASAARPAAILQGELSNGLKI
jgi:hypothetical protein